LHLFVSSSHSSFLHPIIILVAQANSGGHKAHRACGHSGHRVLKLSGWKYSFGLTFSSVKTHFSSRYPPTLDLDFSPGLTIP